MSLGRGPSGTLGGHSTVSSPLSVSYRERTPFRLHLSSSLRSSPQPETCALCAEPSPSSFRGVCVCLFFPLKHPGSSSISRTFLVLPPPPGETGGDPAPASGEQLEQLVAQPGLAREEPPGGGVAGSWAALALGLSFGLSIKFRCLYYDKF